MQAVERLLLGLVIAVAVVGVLVTVALFTLAGKSSDAAKASDRQAEATEKRACIEAAVARYPAVSVSAFVTRDRSQAGPLKLSFVKERQKAITACGE